MRGLVALTAMALLAGCASMGMESTWTVDRQTDQFYDTSSCVVRFDDAFKSLPSYKYGVRYYPFFTKAGDGKSYFGVGSNYNVPAGDVLVRIDDNDPIRVESSETPVSQSSYTPAPVSTGDEATDERVNAAMKQAMASASPITMATPEKSAEILRQAKAGSEMKIRIIGFGVNNSNASTDGSYPLNANLTAGLTDCGI
ncbi:hypothetical protein ACS8E6_01120 [Salinicola halophyticus]|uniref:hypothetical protein n=1 Tax=Salinicola halophyticus TaxID=1808881 RepID=UPI003F48E78F